jgi:gas vesicle protein
MSNSTGNTFLALLTGAVIGAGIGILFAPDKGSKPEKNERWF